MGRLHTYFHHVQPKDSDTTIFYLVVNEKKRMCFISFDEAYSSATHAAKLYKEAAIECVTSSQADEMFAVERYRVCTLKLVNEGLFRFTSRHKSAQGSFGAALPCVV